MFDLVVSPAADPRRAYASAKAMAVTSDPGFRVMALRVLGLACKELGRLGEGLAHLREALRTAEAEGLTYAAAQVRMNLVGLLTARGDIAGALASADAAARVLTGADADRLVANRACVLARRGDIAEVTRIARTCSDPEVLVGLRVNTGLAKVYAGRLGRGEADLRAALAVAERSGLHHQAAMVRHNLAVIAMRRGDLPRALALYDDVEPRLAGAGERLCQLALDRAETLIVARLPGEARGLLTGALATLDGAGYRCDTADALLLLAHAELADGAARAAAATARRAREAADGRQGVALLAEQVGLHARWAAGDRSPELPDDAARTAERLAASGWASAATEARALSAIIALHHGLHDLAERLPARPTGTVAARVATWHATSLLRLARGDRRGAGAAVRAGLRTVEEHAAALGATELRGRAAGWGADLTELGLRLATGPRALLLAAERARAVAHRPTAVRPPRDRRLAGLLAELRRVSAEATERPELVAAQERLEAAVRARTRRLRAAPETSGGWAWLVPALSEALGDRVLVELVRRDDDLLAVLVTDGRCRLHRVGSYPETCRDARLLRSAVTHLAYAEGGRAPRGAHPDPADVTDRGRPDLVAVAHRRLAGVAGRLDARLFGPLRLGDRPVVLAPCGALHALPWAALPSLAGRALTVAPSAASWLHAVRAPAADGPVTVVAGPDLGHAEDEAAAIGGHHPGARILTGPAATVDAVREALDGSSVAHLAAHGAFRAGNALFSSLRLADGPLITYDLERLRRPPRLMVLSACDAGRVDVVAGEAVLGMVSALLTFGMATVVAGVTPVGDAAARAYMAAVHERLAAGGAAAEALALVPRPAAALGFVCFGAGW